MAETRQVQAHKSDLGADLGVAFLHWVYRRFVYPDRSCYVTHVNYYLFAILLTFSDLTFSLVPHRFLASKFHLQQYSVVLLLTSTIFPTHFIQTHQASS